ncbi:MAG: hypothetical protein OXM54_09820 [Acidimicrobiaceae bacterium]|nr:hypothetical protein [Acidimicrobiaceae bacterium]
MSERTAQHRASSDRNGGFVRGLAGYTAVVVSWSLTVEWLAVPAWLNLAAVAIGTTAFAAWHRGRPADEWGFMWLASGTLCMRALDPFIDPFVNRWLQAVAATAVVAVIVVWDRCKRRRSSPAETGADGAS